MIEFNHVWHMIEDNDQRVEFPYKEEVKVVAKRLKNKIDKEIFESLYGSVESYKE